MKPQEQKEIYQSDDEDTEVSETSLLIETPTLSLRKRRYAGWFSNRNVPRDFMIRGKRARCAGIYEPIESTVKYNQRHFFTEKRPQGLISHAERVKNVLSYPTKYIPNKAKNKLYSLNNFLRRWITLERVLFALFVYSLAFLFGFRIKSWRRYVRDKALAETHQFDKENAELESETIADYLNSLIVGAIFFLATFSIILTNNWLRRPQTRFGFPEKIPENEEKHRNNNILGIDDYKFNYVIYKEEYYLVTDPTLLTETSINNSSQRYDHEYFSLEDKAREGLEDNTQDSFVKTTKVPKHLSPLMRQHGFMSRSQSYTAMQFINEKKLQFLRKKFQGKIAFEFQRHSKEIKLTTLQPEDSIEIIKNFISDLSLATTFNDDLTIRYGKENSFIYIKFGDSTMHELFLQPLSKILNLVLKESPVMMSTKQKLTENTGQKPAPSTS